MTSPGVCLVCDGSLTLRHAGLWCDRCHLKIEGCCEGAPSPLCAPAADGPVPRSYIAPAQRRWEG